ncbi:hypothetical protein [Paenibacillus soyae]|uniref:Uncharacterized protein n=1 Tax=Paenibacillus soyae TaxID=2969249 RepID=A0A9X2S8X2_9BACL|nr:hypothetical protein [Paenibacillus soyae]MCR2804874.1 hypothetical protein [Paenibacillus soyae]
MNQYSQQPVQFQGGRQNFSTQSQFQPSGFVQSSYQGQLSQPSFGRTQQSIVSSPTNNSYGSQNTQYGYQQNSASAYSSFNQPAITNTFISHQPVQSHASSPATAFGNVGPVIARVGYQAGIDNQNQGQYQSQSQFGQQQSYYQPVQSSFAASNTGMGLQNQNQYQAAQGFGMSQVHSSTTSQHPVYEATNAYQQAGPVISQLGYQAGNSNSNFR